MTRGRLHFPRVSGIRSSDYRTLSGMSRDVNQRQTPSTDDVRSAPTDDVIDDKAARQRL